MTREMLYDAITEIKDDLVVEAMETEPAKSRVRWLKFGSIAAAVTLAAGLGAGVFSGKLPWLPIGGSAGGSGHEDNGSTFMSYAGPVFPLTTVEGGGGLTAERAITYDFEGWMDGNPDRPYYGLPVTDSYTLTNPTGEDKTVTLLYPFASSLYGLSSNLPALTAGGMELDTEVLAGGYCGGAGNGFFYDSSGYGNNWTYPRSWVDYQTILSDGSYQASALGEWPDLSHIPVTVYEITNPWLAGGITGANPSIHAKFALDNSKTTVLSYGFNGGFSSDDEGVMTRRLSFSVPIPPVEPDSPPLYYERELNQIRRIIVFGQPLYSFELLGVHDGAPDSTGYLEWGVEIGASLRQYETDLEAALRAVAEDQFQMENWRETGSSAQTPEFELYFGIMKDCLLSHGLLSGDPAERFALGWLDEMDCVSMDRVFYLKAQLTVPAGGSAAVEASFLKDASFDYYCANTENRDVYGYDLVTRLGSSLDFTQQTAAAVNTDGVEIIRQNFGFDWENGVDTVTLDPVVEHYYLEARPAGKK